MTSSAKELAIVTGAPGWLGTKLVESLILGLAEVPRLAAPSGRKVRVLALPGADISDFAPFQENVQIVRGDLKDGSGLDDLFRGAEGATVFHVAGVIHPTQGVKELYQVNVEGTRRMLDKATANGARRFAMFPPTALSA
jgi:Nucleoside-diphosphate-sugar epimerases